MTKEEAVDYVMGIYDSFVAAGGSHIRRDKIEAELRKELDQLDESPEMMFDKNKVVRLVFSDLKDKDTSLLFKLMNNTGTKLSGSLKNINGKHIGEFYRGEPLKQFANELKKRNIEFSVIK